jgi:maltose alpha-D-glucosyltransferase/alpha-amylase
MDPIYGYEAVNVEAQQADPSSLLNWTRNMIALRKLFRVFGRGTLEFLHPTNRKVLAYIRRYESEQVLCVANLSRFAQPVELDLSAYEGMTPVEMLGYVEFPSIRRQPYPLTLGPYGFLWFELHGEPQAIAARASQTLEAETPLDVSLGWSAVFEGPETGRLQGRVLPRFLASQRWFGGKARRIAEVHVEDWGAIDGSESVLVVVRVAYDDADPDRYVLPLAMSFGTGADAVLAAAPASVICAVTRGQQAGILHDALADDATCLALLGLIESEGRTATRYGSVRGSRGASFEATRGSAMAALPPRRVAAEQSNTSVIFAERLILKLLRRYQAGVNPECELDRFLTERAHFTHVPPYAGSLEYEHDGQAATLGILQGMVPNEGDGWTGALEELQRYYEASAPKTFPRPAGACRDLSRCGRDAGSANGGAASCARVRCRRPCSRSRAARPRRSQPNLEGLSRSRRSRIRSPQGQSSQIARRGSRGRWSRAPPAARDPHAIARARPWHRRPQDPGAWGLPPGTGSSGEG